MKAYLVSWTDFMKNLRVEAWADEQSALDAENRLTNDRSALVTVGWERLTDNHTISGTLLIALYNELAGASIKKFETRELGARRTFAALEKIYGGAAVNQGTEPDHKEATEEMSINESVSFDETSVEPAAPETPKVETLKVETPKVEPPLEVKPAPKKKAPAKRASGANQPHQAKAAAEFKPVRKNTARCMVLERMDGTRTPDAIALEVFGRRKDGKYVMQHAYCTHRDCGIGYELVEGNLLALYPEGRTFANSVKEEKAA